MDLNEIKKDYEQINCSSFILEKYIFHFKKHLLDPKTTNIKMNNATVTLAINDCHNFDKFLSVAYPEIKSIDNINSNHISFFIKFCSTALYNENKTINKKLRSIRKLFDFLTEQHTIEYNPALKVKYLKQSEDYSPKYIRKGELEIIFSELRNLKHGIRDVCIAKFLTFTGLHLNEIFKLTLNDLNMQNKQFSLLRDSTTYTYDIPDKLYNDLKEYLMLRIDFLEDKCYKNQLFISSTGKAYTTRSFQYKFKSALLGTNFNYTPRNLRASFCYYMSSAVNEHKLKEILNQDKVSHYYIHEIKDNPLID